MSKHTPGPWRITGKMTKYIEASLRPGWLQEVCSVGPTEADKGYGEHQLANARLISAAPELLDVLIEVEDYLRNCANSPDIADKARAAIAKATGETE